MQGIRSSALAVVLGRCAATTNAAHLTKDPLTQLPLQTITSGAFADAQRSVIVFLIGKPGGAATRSPPRNTSRAFPKKPCRDREQIAPERGFR
jgi:hypothetical protein